jgi:DNA-binding NtrC family response regulator
MSLPTVSVVLKSGIAHALQLPAFLLKVHAGPDKKREFKTHQTVVRIGSAEGADLLLNDPTVSAIHAQIIADTTGFRVCDLGAKNGVVIDGRRVKEAWLKGQDEFSLGRSVIRFKLLDDVLQTELSSAPRFGRLRGHSVAMRELFSQLERAARSEATMLLMGETGTGKELAAEALVTEGGRRDKPLVVVDCGRMHATLAESELFGHVKGSFTGAVKDFAGAFERASGGTLFLDEIGELPLELQPKLLSVLERRWVQRVGDSEQRPVDVRVIAATNRDLEREVNLGTFRADLFYRISALVLRMPALRERPEDVPELVAHFLEEAGATLPGPVLERLYRGEYPGNVRQLRAAVERAILGLEEQDLSLPGPTLTGINLATPYRLQKERMIEAFDKGYFAALLEACNGNVSEAARRSGVSRVHLHAILQRLRSRERDG